MAPIQHVIIAIAMEAEAKPFIDHYHLTLLSDVFPEHTPFMAYGGIHDFITDTQAISTKVTVIVNGKDRIYGTGVDNCGTVPAALAVYLAIQKYPDVDYIVNAGTCGGFARKGATIGSVFLTSAVANHDRRIPIPPFIPYGIGRIESLHTDFIEQIAKEHSYQIGICTTGNSLDKTGEDDQIMEQNDASVKDMEAAAIAYICKMYNNKPYLGIKVVTDIVDGTKPTTEEFLENLHTASESLQRALPKILDSLCQKEL